MEEKKAVAMIEGRNENEENKNQPKGPPLRVDATLHLAWGLTLNFSHDKKQVEMGKIFNNVLEKLEKGAEPDPNDRLYVRNLISFLSTFLRSIGFERSVYFDYLNTQVKKRDEVIKNLNELADVTSFSKEGSIVRIASFFGIGSLAAFARTYFSNISLTLSTKLGLVLFFGFIGLVSVTVLLKVLRGRLVEKAIVDTLKKQEDFWIYRARPNYKESIMHLFQDLSRLVEAQYREYFESGAENVLKREHTIDGIIEDILPERILYSLPAAKTGRLAAVKRKLRGGVNPARLQSSLVENFPLSPVDLTPSSTWFSYGGNLSEKYFKEKMEAKNSPLILQNPRVATLKGFKRSLQNYSLTHGLAYTIEEDDPSNVVGIIHVVPFKELGAYLRMESLLDPSWTLKGREDRTYNIRKIPVHLDQTTFEALTLVGIQEATLDDVPADKVDALIEYVRQTLQGAKRFRIDETDFEHDLENLKTHLAKRSQQNQGVGTSKL